MYDDRSLARIAKAHHLRPGDIDAWGHLNHARAIELFELGRYDWAYARRGADSSADAYGCLPVVIRIDVQYRREVFLSDVLVSTELAGTKHYSAEFVQTIAAPAQPEHAAIVGRVWLSFLDPATRRPMRVQNLELLRS